MDIINLVHNFFKFLGFVVHLLNCGDSLTTFLPTIPYIIGCLLTCYTIYLCYFQYRSRSQEHIKALLLVVVLYGGLFWMGAIFLAKTIASRIIKQDTEVKIKCTTFQTVKVTVIFCSLVAVLPNIAALYLYTRYIQHLRLVQQFNDLIRSIEDNRTELGSSNQIQEIPILERRPQSYINKTHLRSCPNLSKKL